MLIRMGRNWSPHTLLIRIYSGIATLKNALGFVFKNSQFLKILEME